MRFVLVAAASALLAGTALSGTAAASPSNDQIGRNNWGRPVVWPDMGPPRFTRQRVARATINDADEDYDARIRRGYQTDDGDRPRYRKRRSARTAKRAERNERATRRSTREAQRRSRRARRGDTRTSDFGGRGFQGVASYYWQGQRVATGARFNPEGLTAAHRTLPFGTRVRVTHMGNGRSVNVVINDRGPFIAGRVIDLARGAARVIGMTGQGLARVRVTVLGR